MKRILAVGNATVDIINLIERYPEEDDEVRALGQSIEQGGNAANTLVVLSQLGHRCSWAGTLTGGPDSAPIRRSLDQHGIDLGAALAVEAGHAPTSYVTLSRASGSRTIIHHRDLIEYPFSRFERIDLSLFDWVHFEGRNVSEYLKMMQRLKQVRPELRCSLEVEKPREGFAALFPLADLLLFSRNYILCQSPDGAEAFLQAMHQQLPEKVLSAAWGDEGSYAIDGRGEVIHAPAFPPAKLVDTLGAGDTFNAAMIDQQLKGAPLAEALREANRLAGRKCGRHGLSGLI